MAAPASQKSLAWILSLLMVSLVVAGCTAPTPGPTGPGGTTTTGAGDATSPSGTTGAAGGQGMVAVSVKDAPADEFQSVFLSFCRVEVHLAGSEGSTTMTTATTASVTATPAATNTTATSANTSGATGTTTSTGTAGTTGSSVAPVSTTTANETKAPCEAQGASWQTVFAGNDTVDLKAFSGNLSAFLDAATLPAGHYTQVRISIASAYGTKTDGTTVDIRVPSGELKFVGPFTLADDELVELVVDYDLNRSLQQSGPNWSFRPVAQLNVTEDGDADTFNENSRRVHRSATPTTNSTTTTSTPANGPQGTL